MRPYSRGWTSVQGGYLTHTSLLTLPPITEWLIFSVVFVTQADTMYAGCQWMTESWPPGSPYSNGIAG